MGESRFNGRTGEWIRWLGGMVVAGIVAYFTAMGAMQKQIAIIDTREQTRWEEVQRTLQRMEANYQRVLDEWSNGVDRRTGEPLPLQRSIEGRR